jgi:Protein of unknown function (DUF3592)
MAKKPINAAGCRSLRWFGCILLALAILWAGIHAWKLSRSVKAEAVITTLIHGSKRSLRPEFSFEDAQGHRYTARSSLGSTEWDLRPGDRVTVFYQVNDPEGAEIDCFMTLWGPPLLVSGLGLIFLLIGIFHPAAARKEES